MEAKGSFDPLVLCRLKRSHSNSFNLDDADVEFRRGGVRATAGPRLGWSPGPKHRCVPALIAPPSEPVMELPLRASSAPWTCPSHAGAERRCVPGSRSRAWACTGPSVTAGSSPDRRSCRRRSTTWRRWGGRRLQALFERTTERPQVTDGSYLACVCPAGAEHETAAPPEEAAAGAAGARLPRRPQRQTGSQLGDP